MYGAEEAQIGEKKTQFQFSVLSLFLQSIGVVLTDIQDIVFKSVSADIEFRIIALLRILSDILYSMILNDIQESFCYCKYV